MLSYNDFVKYFGTPLSNADFFMFLKNSFVDLGEYNVFNYYISCLQSGVDIGFTDNEGIVDDDDEVIIKEGNPLFSHFIIHAPGAMLFYELPWNIVFDDSREKVLEKAGKPANTKEGYLRILNKKFLVDHYKVDGTVISFDYNPADNSLNSISVRDNNLVAHLSI